jgi:hypothetical protein
MDDVIGYEVIGNSGKPNTGEVAYLFNKKYHRSETTKYVGYENVGALIWGYGESLYERKDCVNKVYSDTERKFVEGSPFTNLAATSRMDNPGSIRILERLGFRNTQTTTKFGHTRYEFELNYGEFAAHSIEDPTPQTAVGTDQATVAQ